MSKRSFRIALAIVAGTLLAVILFAAWFVNRALAYGESAHDGSGAQVEVEITAGMSFPTVATTLADKNIIDKPTWFRLFAMWQGQTTDIKPGKYELKDDLTPKQVLSILVKGIKDVTAKVTIPEGKNMLEVFELVDAAKVAHAKDLEALARDKDFLSRHAIVGDSVEGYLFPDTYEYRIGEKPRVVLDRMIARHQEVWNELAGKHSPAELEKKLGWTDRDVLTLASIVEKEAVDPTERPRIAQVFVNRLTFASFKSRRLETDPTIRYGCIVPVQKSPPCLAWDKSGRLHRAQLDDADNPYNTYQHEGLPPGPISNPGRGAIEAALTPDGSDYLFFVAKNARNHAFARTFRRAQGERRQVSEVASRRGRMAACRAAAGSRCDGQCRGRWRDARSCSG